MKPKATLPDEPNWRNKTSVGFVGGKKMSNFQRRHYEAIAETIRNYRIETYNDMLEALIKLFRSDNPNFDENRFRIACAGFGY